MLTGAIVGNARGRALSNFDFGDSIGLAFQIKDDLLDVEGKEAEVGKKLKEGRNKQTYVKHYGVAASKARIDALRTRPSPRSGFWTPGRGCSCRSPTL